HLCFQPSVRPRDGSLHQHLSLHQRQESRLSVLGHRRLDYAVLDTAFRAESDWAFAAAGVVLCRKPYLRRAVRLLLLRRCQLALSALAADRAAARILLCRRPAVSCAWHLLRQSGGIFPCLLGAGRLSAAHRTCRSVG